MEDIKMIRNIIFSGLIISVVIITGCTGSHTFTKSAHAGDTIAITMDAQLENLKRADISVKIYDSNSILHTLPAHDPRIRALINSYPDPLSKIVIGTETNQNIDSNEISWGDTISKSTNYDKEWFQTILLIDLPDTLATGIAIISIDGTPVQATSINILPGAGTPDTFKEKFLGSISDTQLHSLERGAYFKVSFDGVTIPYGIEINFSHNPDVDNGGTGRAYVVNPRGDVKSINWSDDGTSLKAILMPAKNVALADLRDFKFYVAGEITGLTLANVQGFDNNGNVVTVNATITQH